MENTLNPAIFDLMLSVFFCSYTVKLWQLREKQSTSLSPGHVRHLHQELLHIILCHGFSGDDIFLLQDPTLHCVIKRPVISRETSLSHYRVHCHSEDLLLQLHISRGSVRWFLLRVNLEQLAWIGLGKAKNTWCSGYLVLDLVSNTN